MKNCNSNTAAKKPSLDSGFGAEAPATPPTATSTTRANAASSSGGGISKSSSALEVQQLRTVRKGRTDPRLIPTVVSCLESRLSMPFCRNWRGQVSVFITWFRKLILQLSIIYFCLHLLGDGGWFYLTLEELCVCTWLKPSMAGVRHASKTGIDIRHLVFWPIRENYKSTTTNLLGTQIYSDAFIIHYNLVKLNHNLGANVQINVTKINFKILSICFNFVVKKN